MVRMLNFYSDFIAKVIESEAALRRKDGSTSAIQVRDNLNRSLSEARSSARAAERAPDEEEAAAFAVVAWADEVMTRILGTEWGTRLILLQKEHFQTLAAGNQFFSRLENLGAGTLGAAEVYYAVLCLGFQGQYTPDDPNGHTELRRWRERLWLQLSPRPPRVENLVADRLHPPPYTIPDPGPTVTPIDWKRYVRVAVAVAAVALVVAGIVFYVKQPRSAAAVLSEAREKAAAYQCADLGVTGDDNYTITVTGYMGSADDKERLTGELKALKDVKAVAMQAVVHARPLCEVLEVLKPHIQATVAGKEPSVKARTESGQFKVGKTLIVDGRAADVDGNVYVDFYTNDGDVLHMLPNSLEKTAFRSMKSRFVVGENKENKNKFGLGEPPGEHLVTIFSVEGIDPLFDKDRPDHEKAADYLRALRLALNENAKRLLVGKPFFFDVVQ